MKICIFGASGTELDAAFVTAVEQLGEKLAQRGHSLVFGGLPRAASKRAADI